MFQSMGFSSPSGRSPFSPATGGVLQRGRHVGAGPKAEELEPAHAGGAPGQGAEMDSSVRSGWHGGDGGRWGVGGVGGVGWGGGGVEEKQAYVVREGLGEVFLCFVCLVFCLGVFGRVARSSMICAGKRECFDSAFCPTEGQQYRSQSWPSL